MATIMGQSVVISVSLIAAVQTSIGLGELAVFVIQGAVAGGNVFSVSSVADVDALLAATNITADGADALEVALGQSPRNVSIRVVTYSTTGLPAAFALMEAQTAWDIGVIVIRGVNDVAEDISETAAWIAANPYKYLIVFESPNAGLITSGKPAGLAALERDEVAMMRVAAATSGTSQGAGAGSVWAAKPLVGAAGGPCPARIRVANVDALGLTSTQASFLTDNDAMTVEQLDAGTSATERLVLGTLTYGGNGLTPVVSCIYAVKQIRAYIANFILSKAATSTAILNTPQGQAEVVSVVDQALAGMAAAGHFVTSKLYPLGYSVATSVVGDDIAVVVTLQLPQEIKTFSFQVVGVIV